MDRVESTDLEPCPFCGGEAKYDNADHGPYEWISCGVCGAKGPTVNYNRDGIGSCRVRWNARHGNHIIQPGKGI